MEKTLKALSKELILPKVEEEEDANGMEEIRKRREDFEKTYNQLKVDLSKSLPPSAMSSSQSSPNVATTTC